MSERGCFAGGGRFSETPLRLGPTVDGNYWSTLRGRFAIEIRQERGSKGKSRLCVDSIFTVSRVGRQPTRPNCILQQRHQRPRPSAPPRTPAPLWGCGSGIADRSRGDSSPDPNGRCLRKCPLRRNPRAD